MNKNALLQEIEDAVERWCPAQFRREPFDSQLVRALLQATACVEDLRRAMRGEAPIRPLEDYP